MTATRALAVGEQNAASIASLLLTTETVIAQIPEADATVNAGGGMGGMY